MKTDPKSIERWRHEAERGFVAIDAVALLVLLDDMAHLESALEAARGPTRRGGCR